MKRICVLLLVLLFSFETYAQRDKCWDSIQRGSITYSQKQFDDLVTGYITKSKQHIKLDTADYLRIVQISNTITVNRNSNNEKECWLEKNKLYEQFKTAFAGKSLFENLNNYLGPCIPNLGMGCHYAKYKLDWGGASPNENSLFKVIN